MGEIVQNGQISLLAVQFLAVVMSAIVYSRQRSALDVEKRDRGIFGGRVEEALRKASDALLGVERIDVEQYRALAKRHAALVEECELLKAKVQGLEESVRNLSNKLASRARYERQEAAPPPPEPPAPGVMLPGPAVMPDPENFSIPAGVDPAEYLRSIGVGVPLKPATARQQELELTNHNGRPPGFGVSARKG